jgi:hypothetical protein
MLLGSSDGAGFAGCWRSHNSLLFIFDFLRVGIVVLTRLPQLEVRNFDREGLGRNMDFDHHFTTNTKSRELSPATVGTILFVTLCN